VNKYVDVEHAYLLIAYLIEIARGEGTMGSQLCTDGEAMEQLPNQK
jgi:hypothetical protein